jgi:capsular exopolysaccharide synthesis family protein
VGKTHEALKWAEKEHQLNRQETLPETQPAGRTEPPRRASTRPAMERYEDLKTKLLTRYPNGSLKTFLFTSVANGDGTSTTAVNFATALAKDYQSKVLLIDVNLRSPSLHSVFRIDHVHGLSDIVTRDGRGASPVKVGPGNLYLIPYGRNHSEPVILFQSNGFDQFLKAMKDSYDYVVLDAPPVLDFAECRVICSKVDGVVLVIESGKTNRQVAISAKRQLEDARGNILGVVLNKKKNYIPDFIYRRMRS